MSKKKKNTKAQGGKSESSISNSSRVKKKAKIKFKKFENCPGYDSIIKAQNFESENKYNLAMKHYNIGCDELEEYTKNNVDNALEKRNRMERIENYRRSGLKLQNQQTTKRKKTITKLKPDKVKDIKEEPGYQYCCKGEQYENTKKYDVAIQYYQKGIPMLEDTLKKINSSSKYRERMQVIESYRHKCQKLKNRKVRRKSQHKKTPTNSNNLSLTITKPCYIDDGGILYDNIREGTLGIDIIKSCSIKNMYWMLPIVASSCIHLPLPFNSSMRDPLLEAVICKIEISKLLRQRLRLFLFSYYNVDIIQALFGDHPSMPNVLNDGDDNDDNDDDENDERKYREESDDILFEDKYLERDAISFYRKIIEIEPNVGDEFVIDPNEYEDIYDIMGRDEKINKIRIDKIFKSNAKPLLLSTFQKKSDQKYKMQSKFIIKCGDDLRLDSGAMQMFRFFNSIWSEEGLFYDGWPVQCLLYGVVPMGINFGAIEFIPNCKPLRNVSDCFDKFGRENLKNLVASSAGSYIASFVLGVRDRHFDNVLIRNDGTLFHIDFGYVMGSKLFMDTSKIAITRDLQKLFEDHWDNFIETAVNSYMTLRLHYQEILDYSYIVFDFVDLQCNSSEFLYKMLMMHESDKKAEDYIRSKLIDAPSSWNTKIKNAAHYVATLDIESVVGWE